MVCKYAAEQDNSRRRRCPGRYHLMHLSNFPAHIVLHGAMLFSGAHLHCIRAGCHIRRAFLVSFSAPRYKLQHKSTKNRWMASIVGQFGLSQSNFRQDRAMPMHSATCGPYIDIGMFLHEMCISRISLFRRICL